MINLNERCHSVMGVGFVLQCMLCEGHPGVHKYEPDQQFDHDARFDEGGEFHEEANPDPNVLMATDVVGDLTYWTKRKFLPDGTSELLGHGSHPTPPANLQSNIPKALMRPTLLQARRIVARVQDSLCSPGFDKNDATGLLAQAVAMLDTCLEGQSLAEMEERQQELVSQRDEAEKQLARADREIERLNLMVSMLSEDSK